MRDTFGRLKFADEEVEDVGWFLDDDLLQELPDQSVDIVGLQIFLRLFVGLDLLLAVHCSYNYNKQQHYHSNYKQTYL
jgi:hypothetical protein